MRRPFAPGDLVLVVDSKDRRYLVTLVEGGQFHTHAGVTPHDLIIGLDEGVTLRSTTGARYLVIRPTLSDFVKAMPRGAQVIYPKDLAQLLMLADVFPGARVLEAGVGSGALSIALLRAGASIVGYELREEFAAVARKNVGRFLGPSGPLSGVAGPSGPLSGVAGPSGPLSGVAGPSGPLSGVAGPDQPYDVRQQDVYEGIDETDLDRVMLDLPEPWRVVKHAEQALVPGGIFCAYLPTIGQVSQLREVLDASAFGMAQTVEVLERSWHVQGQSVRPDHRMVAHTGFLTAARLLAPDVASRPIQEASGDEEAL